MEKKYYVQTFGCQMNVYDSEHIAALLEGAGYKSTGHAEKADLIILNTCSIREKAEQKIFSQIGRFKEFKHQNPDLIIGVGGCLAQQWGEAFFKKVDCVDLVFGTHSIHRLPELIEKVKKDTKRIADTSFHDVGESGHVRAVNRKGKVIAYVTIMQGCNNFCSYCIVPYLRGPENSREMRDIVSEVEALAAQGIKEVTLLGQNVNSYGKNLSSKVNFSELLEEIAMVKGIDRIRFTTSHPKDLSPELIQCFSKMDKLCKHIHLPVQSGSDQVLKDMRRFYTKSDYMELVAKLRDACPDISITSDVIVGFPTETDACFEETIDLMEKIRFDNLFSFKYSERKGTEAAKYENKVSDSIKRARLRRLQSLQEQHTLEKNQSMVGRMVEVLVEGRSKNSVAEITGRTRSNNIVNFKGGTELTGETIGLLVIKAYQHSLYGELRNEREKNRCL